jgi:hypothetical protein
MERETQDQERARVWREREALRKEFIGLPDTIQGAQRGEQISVLMRKLWFRYKELGGILHGPDPYEDDSEDED